MAGAAQQPAAQPSAPAGGDRQHVNGDHGQLAEIGADRGERVRQAAQRIGVEPRRAQRIDARPGEHQLNAPHDQLSRDSVLIRGRLVELARLDAGVGAERGSQRGPRGAGQLDLESHPLLGVEIDPHPHRPRGPAVDQALALWRGDPLDGADYPWAESDLRRLRGTQIDLLLRAGNTRLANADARGALDAAERGIEIDQLHEPFWRLALKAEGLLGLREAVTERYATLTQLLDDRLGLRPEPETTGLYRRLLAQVEDDPRR